MSHLNYFVLVVLVTVAFGRRWQMNAGNSIPDFPNMAIEIMGDCVVSGDELIANEIPVRTLTTEEQAEVTQYNARLQQVQQQFKELSDQLRNLSESSANSPTTVSMGNKGKGKGKGKGNKGGKNGRGGWVTPSPAAQALIDQIANLTGPASPSFCNGSDTILYDFIGCSVQNYKVYIGRTFLRNLTTAEVTTMNTFINQSNAWEQWIMSQIQSQNFGGHGGKGGMGGGRGGQGGMGGGHQGMGGMGGGQGGQGEMGGMSGGNGAHGSTTTPTLSKASSPSSVSASSSSSTSTPSTTATTSSPISSKPPFPTMPQFCTLF